MRHTRWCELLIFRRAGLFEFEFECSALVSRLLDSMYTGDFIGFVVMINAEVDMQMASSRQAGSTISNNTAHYASKGSKRRRAHTCDICFL